MGRRITALEVAKEAGVSRSAVSLVLNGRADGFLAKDTQERIREVADRLGYRPNLLAQSLRNQRSKVIGIMSDRAVGGAFDGAIIAGADAVAREAGFMTLAADTGGEPEKAEPVARLLLDRAVEGLIYLTVGLHGTRVLDSFLRVPAALANCYPTADSPAAASLLPVFIPDEPTGGRVAAARNLGGAGQDGADGRAKIVADGGQEGGAARHDPFSLGAAALGAILKVL